MRKLKIHSICGFNFRCWLLVVIMAILTMQPAKAQQPPGTIKEREELISMIEQMAERTEAELDYSDLLDALYLLQQNPININYATYDELKQLFFLTDIQAHQIVNYRLQYGLLVSLYELQAIEGFDSDLIALMEPFVKVSADKPRLDMRPATILKYARHDLFLRYARTLEEQEGYCPMSDSAKLEKPNGYYAGSPDRLYARYGFNYHNRIRAGITADKDAGEEFFKGSQPNGFDFYSAFAYAADLGAIEQLAVGDYHLEFGQGLTLWSGLSFGKSSDAASVVKNQRRIRPNTSVNENLFMRGAAVTTRIKNLRFTGFYSSKKIDANIGEVDTLSQEIQFVTSLQQTGYHRTQAELADRHAIRETLFGGRAEWSPKTLRIGATIYKTQLDKPLQKTNQLYQKFYFSGTENLNYGFDYNLVIDRFQFFGEVAGSENGGSAFLAGLQAALHAQVALSLFYRDYGVKYQNLYSNAIGESSNNQGERGLYAGLRADLTRRWSFSGYADFFSFPWLRYRVDFPSHGAEYLAQLDFRMSREVEMYFRYRYDNKQYNAGSESALRKTDDIVRQNFRFNIAYTILPGLTLKSRLEYMLYDNTAGSRSDGFLIYQDLLFRPEGKPYDISLRYALFDTDNYDTRIYAYENDVLYAFSIPSYYYQGSRFYLLIKYEITNNIDVWLRLAQTAWNNREVVGTGLDASQGNTRTEIKAQVRVKF
ncbi:MAG: helix-hairpin-helix domain-containing protein [Bacteroidales bacterium]|nr:helix-hairpin-helix domain-containing protein [Bacteroidales bacterium]